MKLIRTAGLAGLVLVAGALPAYALSTEGGPSALPTSSQVATSDGPDTPGADTPGTEAPETHTPGTESPETDSPESDSPETESPETEGPGDTGTEPAEPETSGEPNPASAPGRAHAEAMQAWAHCVGEAASGPKTDGQPMPPKTACGDKPVSPGRAKHETSDTPETSAAPGQAPTQPRGHASDHGKSGHAKTTHGRGHAKKH